MKSWIRIVALLVLCAGVVIPALPGEAHNLPMGSSRWCFGQNKLSANLDLGAPLLAELQGIKEGKYDLNSPTEAELHQIAIKVLQPYLNRKLSVTVNDQQYPVRVDRLVVRDNGVYSAWLSIDPISFKNGRNQVQIGYRLFFEETGNSHLNLAYLYYSDATGEKLQNLFDYSQPAGQFTFDSSTVPWTFAVEARLPEPAGAAGQGAPPKPLAPAAAGHASNPVAKGSAPPVRDPGASPTAPARQSDAVRQTSAAAPPAPAVAAAASLHAATGAAAPPVQAAPSQGSRWTTFLQFLGLGIEHILTGYDHIAFLIALIVIGLSIREVLKIITAFTVAHSITLLLAALQIVNIESRYVESAIALSICYVALENLYRKKVPYRWVVTFCFGLIHGFGFASALQELIVGKSNLVLSVLSFNLGVEAGQLMIFLLLLPLLYFLKTKVQFRVVTAGASLAVFALGFSWLVERVFDLKFMPI